MLSLLSRTKDPDVPDASDPLKRDDTPLSHSSTLTITIMPVTRKSKPVKPHAELISKRSTRESRVPSWYVNTVSDDPPRPRTNGEGMPRDYEVKESADEKELTLQNTERP